MCLFSSIRFEKCSFRGNWVSAGGSQYSIGGGVAIFYDYDTTGRTPPVIFDSCEFIDNIAGGEVCNSVSSPIYRAGQGGAIGIIGFSSSTVIISNTSFLTNMALTDSQGIVTSFGGAIMYSLGSHVICDDCTFINNIAWNGLGDDICSGYDDSENDMMSLTVSNTYLDGATPFEAFREHQRLVILVETLCWIVIDGIAANENKYNQIIDTALNITYQDRVYDYMPSDAELLSKQLQELFFDIFKRKYTYTMQDKDLEYHISNKNNNENNIDVENEHVQYSPIFSKEDNTFDTYLGEHRRRLELNKRVYPNILVMSGSCSIYQPRFNSTYEVCAGDLITLIVRGSQDSFTGSLKDIQRNPELTIIGSLTGANLILIGISANMTVVDQITKQAVNLAGLFMLNSTLHFSNNMTIAGSSVLLGSVLSSIIADFSNVTNQPELKSLNIQGQLKTGFYEGEAIPNGNLLQRILSKSDYYPITIVRNCILRIYGQFQIASVVANTSVPALIDLQNGSSIVITTGGNLSLSCAVRIQTTDPKRTSIINNGVIDLAPRLNPSYLTPMTVEGNFIQSPIGKLIFGISNLNYSVPSFTTITNQSILGEIQMFAVDGTVYLPSSDSKTPTAWSVFQFEYTASRSVGLSPIYRYPDGTNFKISQYVDLTSDDHDEYHTSKISSLMKSEKISDTSFIQEFTTSQLSCSHRSEDYQISSSVASDDDYMCYVCLKNTSCGYCGASYGGCVNPGVSCQSGVFKNTEGNCCPRMCRGRGDCVAQNKKKTAFKCKCIIFYQGVSCDNLSVFTYLLITAAVFILLIALITVRYYYFSRQQKAKVLQELRAGLLTGSGDDQAENRSYIQAIQQDLILRDVFVNYEDIAFEGKIGEGSFGEVFKATFRGAQVAVKQMRAPVFMQLSDRDIEEFRSEAYMMSR